MTVYRIQNYLTNMLTQAIYSLHRNILEKSEKKCHELCVLKMHQYLDAVSCQILIKMPGKSVT